MWWLERSLLLGLLYGQFLTVVRLTRDRGDRGLSLPTHNLGNPESQAGCLLLDFDFRKNVDRHAGGGPPFMTLAARLKANTSSINGNVMLR
jgi:hypothetical protein